MGSFVRWTDQEGQDVLLRRHRRTTLCAADQYQCANPEPTISDGHRGAPHRCNPSQQSEVHVLCFFQGDFRPALTVWIMLPRAIEAKPKEERSSRSPNQRPDLRGSAALAVLCSRKERIIAHRAACRYQEPFSSRLRNLGASPRTLRRQKLCGQQPSVDKLLRGRLGNHPTNQTG